MNVKRDTSNLLTSSIGAGEDKSSNATKPSTATPPYGGGGLLS
jgi:hypothetical protein